MEKKMEVSLLLDFYGKLLKDKVMYAMEMYYNDDLSLSEISQDLSITRQGVRDLIKRGETNLYSYEEKLGLYKRFINHSNGLSLVRCRLDDLKVLTNSNVQLSSFNEKINEIMDIVDKLIEEE